MKRLRQKEKDLELLIVEDDVMNRTAAKIYFDKVKGVNIDFAQTYQEAQKKLEENVYAGAIIDLNIPKKEGKAPEKLGFELGKQAQKHDLPYCVFTGGLGHHNQPTVLIYPVGVLGVEYPNKESRAPGKAEPNAWGEAYKALENICPNMNTIHAAKLRYKKFVGINYTRR